MGFKKAWKAFKKSFKKKRREDATIRTCEEIADDFSSNTECDEKATDSSHDKPLQNSMSMTDEEKDEIIGGMRAEINKLRTELDETKSVVASLQEEIRALQRKIECMDEPASGVTPVDQLLRQLQEDTQMPDNVDPTNEEPVIKDNIQNRRPKRPEFVPSLDLSFLDTPSSYQELVLSDRSMMSDVTSTFAEPRRDDFQNRPKAREIVPALDLSFLDTPSPRQNLCNSNRPTASDVISAFEENILIKEFQNKPKPQETVRALDLSFLDTPSLHQGRCKSTASDVISALNFEETITIKDLENKPKAQETVPVLDLTFLDTQSPRQALCSSNSSTVISRMKEPIIKRKQNRPKRPEFVPLLDLSFLETSISQEKISSRSIASRVTFRVDETIALEQCCLNCGDYALESKTSNDHHQSSLDDKSLSYMYQSSSSLSILDIGEYYSSQTGLNYSTFAPGYYRSASVTLCQDSEENKDSLIRTPNDSDIHNSISCSDNLRNFDFDLNPQRSSANSLLLDETTAVSTADNNISNLNNIENDIKRMSEPTSPTFEHECTGCPPRRFKQQAFQRYLSPDEHSPPCQHTVTGTGRYERTIKAPYSHYWQYEMNAMAPVGD